MPFFLCELGNTQPLKPQLTFNPLTQLLVMVGQLSPHPPPSAVDNVTQKDLELVAFPEPEQRPHPVIAPFCFLVHSPGDWLPPELLQRLIGHLPPEESPA